MMVSSETKQREDFFRLLNIYKQAVDTKSANNRFRGCLYNKIAV